MSTSDQQLAIALKVAKCGIWDWYIPEEKVFYGPNYYRIAGYEPNEFPHSFEEWEKRVHPDDVSITKKTIQQYLAGELNTFTSEFRFKTKSGNWMWLLSQGEVTERDEKGNPTRFIGLHIDITQSKNTEIAFQKERSLSTSLINTAQLMILIMDIEGRISRINPFMENITGYKEAEVKGKDWFDTFLPPADHTELRTMFRDAIAGIGVSEKINSIVTKDGRELVVEWYSKTLKDTNGVIIGLLSAGIDISERKVAEKALQESESTFRKLFEDSSDPILLINDSGVFVECNQAALDLLKMTKEQFIFLSPAKISPQLQPDGRRSDEAALEMIAIAHSKGKCRFDWTCINSEKVEFIVEVSLIPITIKGEKMFHASWRDITDRKRAEAERLDLEAQLRQKYKMEAVGVMAGGMAHNFNNNLSIILGNLELTKMKLSPQSHLGEYLDNARTAILRSRDLIKQIMIYSRKDKQHLAPLELSSTIGKFNALLKSTIPSSVTLQQTIHPDSCKTNILANVSQIQEILLNLCNNAVHAMDEQGKLTINLETVELKQQQIPAHCSCTPGFYLHLSVQDTGCGIAPEIQDKIFDPFFTTKEVHEGTGMGLSTVQGIMEQLQGIIAVESHVGQGTTFHLYFTPIDATVEASPAETPTDLPQGTEHILFVDDDEMLATIAHQMLSAKGYQVTMMTDSQQALKLFSANADNFHLVITDQTMPGITGKELILAIKQQRPDIPTIICTGYSSKVDENEARKLGINAFLMKPLTLPELLQTVRWVLDTEAKR